MTEETPQADFSQSQISRDVRDRIAIAQAQADIDREAQRTKIRGWIGGLVVGGFVVSTISVIFLQSFGRTNLDITDISSIFVGITGVILGYFFGRTSTEAGRQQAASPPTSTGPASGRPQGTPGSPQGGPGPSSPPQGSPQMEGEQ